MNSISFGQSDVTATTDKSVKRTPAKTHAGLYTGIVTGAIGSLLARSADSFAKTTGAAKPAGALACLIPLAMNIGIGTLIDSIRNKRMAKFAEETQGLSSFKAVEKDEDAELTPKGNPYVKMATGKKYGTLSFAVLTPLIFAIKSKSLPSALMGGILAINGAISGLVFGAIADYFSNKTARKAADENPYPKTDEPAKKE